MATATKTNVTRSATIGLKSVSVDDIVAGATKVGAPSTARVTTGGGVQPQNGEEYLPYSVTYSWDEEV